MDRIYNANNRKQCNSLKLTESKSISESWYFQEKDDFGDLLLYISYDNADAKLSVTVAKAYNLRPMDITGASGEYILDSGLYIDTGSRLNICLFQILM